MSEELPRVAMTLQMESDRRSWAIMAIPHPEGPWVQHEAAMRVISRLQDENVQLRADLQTAGGDPTPVPDNDLGPRIARIEAVLEAFGKKLGIAISSVPGA